MSMRSLPSSVASPRLGRARTVARAIRRVSSYLQGRAEFGSLRWGGWVVVQVVQAAACADRPSTRERSVARGRRCVSKPLKSSASIESPPSEAGRATSAMRSGHPDADAATPNWHCLWRWNGRAG